MSLKKHPPNNEPCPTCGGPCKMAKCGLCNGNGEHLSGLMFGNSTAHCHECHGTGQLPTDSLHDTLVQQAVDEMWQQMTSLCEWRNPRWEDTTFCYCNHKNRLKHSYHYLKQKA